MPLGIQRIGNDEVELVVIRRSVARHNAGADAAAAHDDYALFARIDESRLDIITDLTDQVIDPFDRLR